MSLLINYNKRQRKKTKSKDIYLPSKTHDFDCVISFYKHMNVYINLYLLNNNRMEILILSTETTINNYHFDINAAVLFILYLILDKKLNNFKLAILTS